MSETIARIGQDEKVELVDDKMVKVPGVAPMSPEDAAFLARSLLSCAAVLTVDPSAEIGALCADAHFPVLKYTIKTVAETGRPLIIFSIPPAIEFSFQMTPEQGKIFGQDLVALANGLPAPQRAPDVIH